MYQSIPLKIRYKYYFRKSQEVVSKEQITLEIWFSMKALRLEKKVFSFSFISSRLMLRILQVQSHLLSLFSAKQKVKPF